VCCASAKTQVQNFELVCANIIVEILGPSQVSFSDPKPEQVASSPKKICRGLGSGCHDHKKYLLAPVPNLVQNQNFCGPAPTL
jgi:hypothetical protein